MFKLDGPMPALSFAVAALVKTPGFRKLIDETISGEKEDLVDLLKKRLSGLDGNTLTLYSLEEAGDFIFDMPRLGKPVAEYLLITNKYLSHSRKRTGETG